MDWHFLSAGPLWLWSKPLDSICFRDQNAAFYCLLAETSLGKKSKIQIRNSFRSKWYLIRLMCAWIRLWSDRSHPELTYDHTIPRPKWPLIIPSQTEVTSDHTIPRPKWPLIIPSPDRSDLWSYHPQTEVTSDHTIVRSNQILDPEILVWEHTVCVGLGLIRGHFRMAPQPGFSIEPNTYKTY